MRHYARLEWAVKNINAVPTGGPVLTLRGKLAEFGPGEYGCDCPPCPSGDHTDACLGAHEAFWASQGAE